jgi:endonuclease YncB( thermonuclease family)
MASAYDSLLTDLQALIEAGRQNAMDAINKIRLDTYWQMGKRLVSVKEELQESTAGSLITKLSEDLALDKALIYRLIQFYETWPNGVPAAEGETSRTLSWSHHIALLAVEGKRERDFYFEKASAENWDRTELRKAIQSRLYESRNNPKATKILKRPEEALYLYSAVVEKVIDGDTLLVRIDLGFNVWVSQRIRFRGINTEEIASSNDTGPPQADAPSNGESPANPAQQAKQFVEEKLKEIPFVVVKTYKTDIYGRYVADVFYHPSITDKQDVARKGFFLNEEILKSGLAVQIP